MRGMLYTKETDTKRCSICKEVKSISNFRLRKSGVRKWGYRSLCKKCQNANASKYSKMPEQRKKLYARQKLRNAVKTCRVVKLPCAVCGNNKTQAHHHNGYEGDNWQVVTWLCQKHHTQAHHPNNAYQTNA